MVTHLVLPALRKSFLLGCAPPADHQKIFSTWMRPAGRPPENSVRKLGSAPLAPKVRDLGLGPESSRARIRHRWRRKSVTSDSARKFVASDSGRRRRPKFLPSDSARKVRELGLAPAPAPATTLPTFIRVTHNTCDGHMSSLAQNLEVSILSLWIRIMHRFVANMVTGCPTAH